MLNKGQKLRRNAVEFLTLEDRIPRDHLLRKIDVTANLKKIFSENLFDGRRVKNEGRIPIYFTA